MKKRNIRGILGVILLALFVLWTILVRVVDVKTIGPNESSVGFASLNGFVHNLTGVHMALYTITDWLGLVPLAFAAGFGILGLAQWIKRKSFLKVDHSILTLGGFYILVFAVFIFFEVFVVNYRPVLIEGVLEVSYPSSTTLLAMCVMSTAILQLKGRMGKGIARVIVIYLLAAFTAFMVIGRLISGVHWLSDIIGGVLLSAGLVLLYHYACNLKRGEF